MSSLCHTVHITGYNSGGEGVARLESGKVVFVRSAAREDVCTVAITNESARSCRAVIVEIIKASPYRVPPGCPVYPGCGGCDFMHITYEEELWAKQSHVNDSLSRIGKSSLQIDEVLTTGDINRYRNKAVFHCSVCGSGRVIGYYSSGSRGICPVHNCLLLSDDLNEQLCQLWHNPPQFETITLRSGSRGGTDFVFYKLDGITFKVSCGSFFQVNLDAAALLYRKAREFASLSASDTVADLYCGVGASTLCIGRDAGYAVGIESNPIAVRDAEENIRLNQITNARFICADASHWDAGDIRPACVVVDPPRRGLSYAAIRKILSLSPARIVYISCYPASMARDIALFDGYTPERVVAIDMFPRTANVECCMLLVRR